MSKITIIKTKFDSYEGIPWSVGYTVLKDGDEWFSLESDITKSYSKKDLIRALLSHCFYNPEVEFKTVELEEK